MRRTLALAVVLNLAWFLLALRPDLYQERMSHARDLIDARLDAAAESFDTFMESLAHASPEEARAAFLQARRDYKRAEAFIEHVDAWAVWNTINGAPLPKTDPQSTYLDILEPVGFQTIEEHLFDSPGIDSTLHSLTHQLHGDLDRVIQHTRSSRFTDRNLIEAVRRSILRIATLSITGFDTPASGAALSEAASELETLYAVVDLYRPELAAKHPKLADRLAAHVGRAVRLVEKHNNANGFDTFDRARLIRESLDPLFGDFLDVQITLGVEFSDEISVARSAVNPHARHIFATDLLDAHYYTGIPRSHERPELVDLGRTLFFDPVLSSTGERACASCHDPSHGFTDGMKTSLALGHDGVIDRNAMVLVNAVFADRYFYDLRAERLEDVIEHVVTNHREFGSTLAEVVERLEGSPEYRRMFEAAFKTSPEAELTPSDVQHALAAYLASLASFNTPVDQYLRGEIDQIDPAVRRGFNLFMGKAACATCHFPPTYAGTVPPLYTDSESEILGVPTAPVTFDATLDPDLGRFGKHVKEVAPFHRFSFKTVTVRNAALTAPYMHNGAYETLDQVVEFYAKGGGSGIGIDLEYQTLPFDTLDLNPQERSDIVAFMKALTDTTGLTARPDRLPIIPDPRFAVRRIGGEY